MNIHARLTTAREAAGLSLRAAARRIDVTDTTLRRWEDGGSCPRADQIDAIADVYGVTRDRLMGPS